MTGVAITSTPTLDSDDDGTADTYRRGDAIDVTVTWDRDVKWDVSAEANSAIVAQLSLGTATRVLPLVTGGAASGTARSLTFRHTVTQDDADSDGVALKKIGGDAVVALANGAALKDAREGAGDVDAALAFAGLDTAAQAGHKVDGSLASDDVAPTVESASVNGATLTMTFDETLGAAANLANDAFTVKRTRHNGAVAVGGPEHDGGAGRQPCATLTLTLAEAVASTDRDVKVSYTAPDAGTDNRIVDLAGNAAASFADRAVANATPGPAAPAACALFRPAACRPSGALHADRDGVDRLTVSYTDQDSGNINFVRTGAIGINGLGIGLTVPHIGAYDVRHWAAADTDYWVAVSEGSRTNSWSPWKHVRTLPGAPSATGVTVTSEPGADETYAIGEAIELTATFNKVVTVTTAGDPVEGPRIAFTLGTETKHAAYDSGSGTPSLVFRYTVAEGDAAADGIAVAADALALNGGAIADSEGTAAALAHAALAAQSGHKVETVRPTVESASVNGTALTVTFDETLGAAASLVERRLHGEADPGRNRGGGGPEHDRGAGGQRQDADAHPGGRAGRDRHGRQGELRAAGGGQRQRARRRLRATRRRASPTGR